ncbi:2-dehydropantoate 2-reductase [Rhizobium deserti]|uniref:2-dehydropantoate 2-reductase n=1 Tax=Rhizobium deserti TaxID=2547961 RepID=A0A4R5UAU8_9HYPH|nr:2-dehydropantoate 2-reductase [Rhizobium deserti]TDK32168.1 2-dehydropantoate 2-reductase [Rhizobium deserti]
MRIAIIGAGAMGTLFAGRLADSGQEILLVEVSLAQIDAIGKHGLRISDEAGETRHILPIGTADRYVGVVDGLVVFTKGMHTRAAVEACRHLIGTETWALTVQNGLGNVEAIEASIGRDRIIMGMTNWPASLVEPGHVQVPGTGEIRIWSAAGMHSQRLDTISEMLSQAGLRCVLDPRVEISIWEKLAFNAAMNSLAAVTNLTVGQMADRPEARALVFAILEEALLVAKARGIDVDAERTRRSVEFAFTHHRPHKPSMLQDRLAGRAMEIDTITGAVAAQASYCGVAAPVTATFARLLTLLDGDTRHSSP